MARKATAHAVPGPHPASGRITCAACVALLAVAFGGGAGLLPGSARAASDVITVALGADLRSTDPGVNRDDFTDAVMSHVVETLVTFRKDLTVVPHLAESIAIADAGRTYTFKLRPGLVFHDGTPVNAGVVRWNWQRYLDAAGQWSCRGLFDGSAAAGAAGVHVVEVEAPAADTVVFKLQQPSTLFLTLLASVQCMPAVYARSSVDAAGAWQKPVGTGPFTFQEWRRGRDVTLTRFARYQSRSERPDGLSGARVPRVEKLHFIVIPDVTASVQAFNAGQVDVLPNLAPNVVADVKRRPGVNLQPQQLLGWTALLLQTRDPLLKDVRIRQAVAHALDREQIARIATGGRGRPNPSAVPSSSPWRSSAHDRFPAYDPTRAKALLKAAGYRGQPLVIQTNRHYPNMYDNAVMAQALLQAVGINARIEVLDWATQLSNYQAGKFQVSSFSFSPRFDPALTYGQLLGDKKERRTVQWESGAAMQLLAATGASDDASSRGKAFEQLHALMAQDVPIIGLYNGVSIAATAPGISGYRTWPGATPILWEVTNH
jgi:peptide/nickel transport system substrate-binding protein